MSMQENLILGIDPGLRHTGWGIISYKGSLLKLVASGVIDTNSKEKLSHRLLFLSEALKAMLDKYQPVHAAMEEIFLNKNPATTIKLSHARGAIMASIAAVGVEIEEYAPKTVKKTIVGVGNADKEQVLFMIKRMLPGKEITSYDEADALAVAICHAHHYKIVQKAKIYE
jgi:crossover junction endodeoxyribonuclease RuvC